MRFACALLLATAACTASDPVIALHWADDDADCTNVHINATGDSGQVVDTDQSCGFCLDLGGGCNGYDFKFSIPDGSTGVVVTTQVSESGDDPDDHPPPTLFQLDSPLHADATYEVPL